MMKLGLGSRGGFERSLSAGSLFPGRGTDFGFDELHFADVVVAAAEFGDVTAQAGEGAEFLGEFRGDFAIPVQQEGRMAGGEDGGQMIGEPAGDGLLQLAGIGGEVLGIREDFMAEFLAELPVGVAAQAPVAEVLFADGLAVELFVQDGLDGGEGVEPSQESFTGFAVLEAAVELFPDFVGEAGDFSIAGGVHKNGGFIRVMG